MTLSAQSPALAGAPWEEVTVAEVMHPGIVVCSPGAPARVAARLMAQHRIHAVVLMADDDEGCDWSVLTDADLLEAAARGELDGLMAGDVARARAGTVSRRDSLERARELMRAHGVTHLLVTGRGRPVGVVSTLDLVQAVAAGVGATLRPQSASV
jgi:CBS domain-containing protein